MLLVRPPSTRFVSHLGVATFVLSFVLINLLWLLSMYVGQVPVCFPYLDGAISVSYAIRTPPAVYVTKPALAVVSLMMMAYLWCLVWQAGWLRRGAGRAIVVLGLVSGLFLWLYLYALGVDGSDYRLLRRVGTYGHIVCGTVAQIIATVLLWSERRPSSQYWLLALWCLIAWMLFMATAGISLLAAYTSLSQARRAVEWHYFLAMFSWFGVSAWSRRL